MEGLVGLPITGGEEGEELAFDLGAVAAEEEEFVAQSGEEVVGIPAEDGQVEAQEVDELRGHQAQQISAGRGAEARGVGEGVLRADRAAEDVAGLQDVDVEAGPGKKGCCDEAVVAGAGDHDTGHQVPPGVGSSVGSSRT